MDLRHFRSREPADWRRLDMAMRYLERRQDQKLLELEYERALTLLQRTTGDAFGQVAEVVDQIFASLEDHIQPWAAIARERGRHNIIEAMRQQWVETFGDPQDPATLARIEATVRFLSED